MGRNDLSQTASLEEWRRWKGEVAARRWLAENMKRAQFQRLDDREVLKLLRELPLQNDRVALLDVLCDRAEEDDNGSLLHSIGRTLTQLAKQHPGPGKDAVAVDHAIQRLLPRLSAPIGSPLAAACLKSSRRRRNAAAWKYYHRQGLDSAGRNLLADAFSVEEAEEYLKLVAGDPQLVRQLGPEAVLQVAPNRYWRSRALEAVLVSGGDDTTLRHAYPAEWLWAVARLGAREKVAEVLAFLDREDVTVDIVNRVLLCVTQLRDRAAIDRALAEAEVMLEEDPPSEPSAWESSDDD